MPDNKGGYEKDGNARIKSKTQYFCNFYKVIANTDGYVDLFRSNPDFYAIIWSFNLLRITNEKRSY